jgi:hypothetical protein
MDKYPDNSCLYQIVRRVFSEMMKMAIRKNNNFLQVLSDILHEQFKCCNLLFPAALSHNA